MSAIVDLTISATTPGPDIEPGDIISFNGILGREPFAVRPIPRHRDRCPLPVRLAGYRAGMLTDLLVFGLGTLVGLALHRNQQYTDARIKARELFIELEARVATWPKDSLPMQSPAEDRDWRAFIKKFELWMSAARMPSDVVTMITTSADATWRGHPTNIEYTWQEGRNPYPDDRTPYESVLGILLPMLSMQLSPPSWRLRWQLARHGSSPWWEGVRRQDTKLLNLIRDAIDLEMIDKREMFDHDYHRPDDGDP